LVEVDFRLTDGAEYLEAVARVRGGSQ
jgi:hypothetical protein